MYMWRTQVYTAAALLRRRAQTKSHFLATVSLHAVTYVTTLFCFYFQHTEIGYMISDVQRIVSAAVYVLCRAQ